MWRLIQIAAFTGVMVSNIREHWTPNWALASFVGMLFAFWVTLALAALLDLLRRGRHKLFHKQSTGGGRHVEGTRGHRLIG